MKRYNVSGLTFAMALCGLLAVSCGGRKTPATTAGAEATEATAAPKVEFPVVQLSDSLLADRGADTIDMGRMHEGERVVRTIMLRNAGKAPLVVTGLEKTCDCLDIDYPRAPVMPGEEARMELSFDSKRISGWVYKTIGLRTSLGAKAYVLVVTAEVE